MPQKIASQLTVVLVDHCAKIFNAYEGYAVSVWQWWAKKALSEFAYCGGVLEECVLDGAHGAASIPCL
jgi:hypothetical protein